MHRFIIYQFFVFFVVLYHHKPAAYMNNPEQKKTLTNTLNQTSTTGVRLKLTVIETPGFGDYINNEESWRPILKSLEARFDSYLEQETRVNRKAIVDSRVHALIYFIPPNGHSLRPLDVEFMKRVCGRVNLVPVIAKSDALTETEVLLFKKRV
jgi:septin 7